MWLSHLSLSSTWMPTNLNEVSLPFDQTLSIYWLSILTNLVSVMPLPLKIMYLVFEGFRFSLCCTCYFSYLYLLYICDRRCVLYMQLSVCTFSLYRIIWNTVSLISHIDEFVTSIWIVTDNSPCGSGGKMKPQQFHLLSRSEHTSFLNVYLCLAGTSKWEGVWFT